jgi:membrane associated rhomboid family serine protease
LYGVIGCIGGLAFISRSSIHGLSFYSFAVYIALTVFSGLIDPRMNNAAHIGGALAGFICGVIIAYIKKKNIERATA